MKLLIIRHGDPNYEIDSLTEQGVIEAELLAQKLCKMDIKAFYVSPLGRAQKTASYTLEKMGRQAQTLDWLREFPPQIDKPNDPKSICWDWLPKDWLDIPEFHDVNKWFTIGPMKDANVEKAYRYVCEGLDQLLADHGYVRKGLRYEAVAPNEDTIVLFCHFGLECILLSHLINISPMLLWHGACAAPTSVTRLITEERERGIAYFRMGTFGDVSHLYVADVEPAFSARFCETFDTPGQRH